MRGHERTMICAPNRTGSIGLGGGWKLQSVEKQMTPSARDLVCKPDTAFESGIATGKLRVKVCSPCMIQTVQTSRL